MNKKIIAALISSCTLALMGCASLHSAKTTAVPTAPVATKSGINVTIQSGQMMFANNNSPQPYLPFTFQISDGQCKRVTVTTAAGATTTTTLKSCYSKNILYIDEGRFNFDRKTLLIHAMPLWSQGFTYQNLSSNGPAHLNNVSVTVQAN